MLKNFKRFYFLWKLCDINEFVFLLYHFFITKKLSQKNIQLQRLLVFAIACADKGYKLTPKDKTLIKVSGIGKDKNLSVLVRKYTRDLLVFEGFFIFDDYQKFIKQIQEKKIEIKYIIDAGANIGCATLYLHSYFPEATIVCIEPEKTNFDLLCQNIKLNNIQNKVYCVQKALWNELKELELRRVDYSHDGFHVMTEGITHEIIDKVSTCTIPELCKENQIDILKIDIEGAEKALFTDQKHLQEFLPQTQSIIMEVHQEHISDDQIIKTLNEFHFTAFLTQIEGQPSAILAFNQTIKNGN
jgi:FkbM family methyltransferase